MNLQGDQKHLALAHLFDKPCFLGLLAVKVITFLLERMFQPVGNIKSVLFHIG